LEQVVDGVFLQNVAIFLIWGKSGGESVVWSSFEGVSLELLKKIIMIMIMIKNVTIIIKTIKATG
jgi:hypothetical protein